MSTVVERHAVALGELLVGDGPAVVIGGRVSLRGRGRAEPYAVLRERRGPVLLAEPASAADLPAIAELADAVVVGASWTRDIPLVRATAALGLPVVVERRASASLEEWLGLAGYCAAEGDGRVILCEGGRPDLGLMRAARAATGRPVLVDVSADPGLSAAAVAAGADGLIVSPCGAPRGTYGSETPHNAYGAVGTGASRANGAGAGRSEVSRGSGAGLSRGNGAGRSEASHGGGAGGSEASQGRGVAVKERYAGAEALEISAALAVRSRASMMSPDGERAPRGADDGVLGETWTHSRVAGEPGADMRAAEEGRADAGAAELAAEDPVEAGAGLRVAEEAVTVVGALLRDESPTTLAECRQAIDRVDAALATLLERRAALAGIVQRIKPVGGFAGRDLARERAVVARMALRAPTLGETRLAPIMNAVIEAGLHLAEERAADRPPV
ncbi:chorismate mutase [Nonomuraea aridisoli]|uniref:chorismate mutase n=1 Tax=Nonomuraea aridisoli TaxID=2070368 RepID=UPI0026CECCDB